jgi:hypothetical protein
MLVCKERGLTGSGEPERLRPYPQTLDYSGKAYQGPTRSLTYIFNKPWYLRFVAQKLVLSSSFRCDKINNCLNMILVTVCCANISLFYQKECSKFKEKDIVFKLKFVLVENG